MRDVLVYSAIVTKVRVMESRLLTSEQFETIANLHSVLEVVSYLKENTSYSGILKEIDEHTLHRGDVEKILVRSLYQDYAKIYQFCNLQQRKFLRLYMRAYEIDLINYCFRIVSNHYAQPFDLNDKKPFFDQYSQLSIEKLITVNTPEELVENLRDTEYYRPLKRVQDSTNATLFDYDLALNLYYYTTLWKEQKKILKKEDLALFKRDCGVKIDLLNIQWIYRAKRYYKMSSAEIISLLIPIHYRISKEMILGLIEAGSRDDFYKILTRTPYYRPNISAQEYTLEKLYTDYLSHVYMTDRSKRPYSFATINTYLFLKEEEINKLTTALECIRYGLTPGETLAYIGGRT